MGHLPLPNLCGGLLALPYLVVVGLGCSSFSSALLPAGLSTVGSFPGLIGVFGPGLLCAFFDVAPFGRPL